ncbi:MAG: PepSY domain-containing protein [Alcanivoracaceae bacterium]|nr:PepSY domain-containing protein [Alcanivoracaceae bacterium]
MRRLLLVLRRWHRWLGVLVTLPVIVLCITGLLLNHSDGLGLGKTPMPAWLAGSYGVNLPQSFKGVPYGDDWLVASGERLYRVPAQGDTSLLADCPAPLRGGVRFGVSTVVACNNDLLLLDEDGRVREQLGPAWGVPPFERLGRHGDALVLEASGELSQFSLTTLATSPLPDGVDWEPAQLASVPDPLVARVRPLSMPASLHWERLLQDLHSGRLFGAVGERIMDLAALVLVLLAVSGITMWWRLARRSPSGARRTR